MTYILLTFLFTAMTEYLYHILGRPYMHENAPYVAEPDMIFAKLGIELADRFGTPCLVCINTWVVLIFGALAAYMNILPAYYVVFMPPVGYLMQRGIDRYL